MGRARARREPESQGTTELDAVFRFESLGDDLRFAVKSRDRSHRRRKEDSESQASIRRRIDTNTPAYADINENQLLLSVRIRVYSPPYAGLAFRIFLTSPVGSIS